jgi:acyl carrier protein
MFIRIRVGRDCVGYGTDSGKAGSKTTSAKKRGGKVGATTETTPEQEREALTMRLKDEVARLLDASPIEMNAASPLSELGLDSMGLTQLRGILQNKFDVSVEEPELFDEGMTLNKLVLRIQNKDAVKSGGGSAAATEAAGGAADGPRSAAGANNTNELVASRKGCCSCF